jgi:hypothetical protein
LWYVVLLRAGASQIREKESAMQHDEILEMVITELTERGYKQQRNENPEVDDLVLRRIELSQQVKECVSSLSQEAQDTLEEYHNTMDILSGHQIKYLYLQGAKDCVSLLQELGVIR